MPISEDPPKPLKLTNDALYDLQTEEGVVWSWVTTHPGHAALGRFHLASGDGTQFHPVNFGRSAVTTKLSNSRLDLLVTEEVALALLGAELSASMTIIDGIDHELLVVRVGDHAVLEIEPA
jgi:hypothetical protein